MAYDPKTITAENMQDPQITAQELADIAAKRPDLWGEVERHPNCYPALQAWIEDRRKDSAPAPEPLSQAAWQEKFQQDNGREPTLREYQEAVLSGLVKEERVADDSVGDMQEGLKQFAAGAKTFVNNRVTPNVVEQAATLKGDIPRTKNAKGIDLGLLAPAVLLGSQLLAFISLFLPVVKIPILNTSLNFFANGKIFDAEYSFHGGWILFAIILVTVPAVLAILQRKKWAYAAAGALGALIGLILSIKMLSAIYNVSGTGVTGVGLVFMFIAALVELASAILCLVIVFKKQNK